MNKYIKQILLLILCLSCNQQKFTSNNNNQEKIESKSTKLKMEYNLANSNSDKLIKHEVASINLPSGEIIAGDPFFIQNTKPFKRKVTPGKYPVLVLLSKIEEDHYRIAYAKIKFRNESANKWTLAITADIEEEELKKLNDDDFFGFGVDSGLACFTDKITNNKYNNLLIEFYNNNPNSDYYNGVLKNEFINFSSKNKYTKREDWNNHIVDKDKDLNIVMFASGWGDGHYPTYWGLNNSDEVVELTIDFMVENEE